MLFSGMHHSPTAVNFRGQLQGIGSLTRGQLIIVRLYTLPTDNISVHTNTHTHRNTGFSIRGAWKMWEINPIDTLI